MKLNIFYQMKPWNRERFFHAWVACSLVMFFLFLPISNTIKELTLCSMVIPLLLTPTYRQRLAKIFQERWCVCLIGFYLLLLLSCFWSPATGYEKFVFLKKYIKFLYIPFLVTALRITKTQKTAMYAYFLAMSMVCMVSIYKDFMFGAMSDPGDVFFDHITTGMMVAFAAYFSMIFFIKEKSKMRYFWLLLWVLFSYQVFFVNTGRTGYFLYVILSVVFVSQSYSWKKICLSLILISAGLFLTFQTSSVMQYRIQRIADDIRTYHQHKNTSMGFRFQFHHYAYNVFKKHWVLGIGNGGLSHDFKVYHRIPAWTSKAPFQPHNQYWLIAAEQGVVGLFFFIGLLWVCFSHSARSSLTRPFALATYAMIGSVCMIESPFPNTGQGFFMIAFMALCLFDDSKSKEMNLLPHSIFSDARLRQV